MKTIPLYQEGQHSSAPMFVSKDIWPPTKVIIKSKDGFEYTGQTSYFRNGNYKVDIISIANSKELIENDQSRISNELDKLMCLESMLIKNKLTGKVEELIFSESDCNRMLFTEHTHEYNYALIEQLKFACAGKSEVSFDFDLAINLYTGTHKLSEITSRDPDVEVLGFKIDYSQVNRL